MVRAVTHDRQQFLLNFYIARRYNRSRVCRSRIIKAIDTDMISFNFDAEAFFRKAPAPLSNRVRDDLIVLIAFADQPGQAATFAALKDELSAVAPLPVRLTVIGELGDEQAVYRAANLETCPTQGAEYVRLLLQAEAALLPESLCGQHLPALCQCVVPLLVEVSADSSPWRGAGIGVEGASIRERAGLLLLLATDPPVRRCALLAPNCGEVEQNRSEGRPPIGEMKAFGGSAVLGAVEEGRGMVTVPKNAWVTGAPPLDDNAVYRVDGVFDSSYSLAIVNRQLAMALEDVGRQVALYTYEQGPEPQPNWNAVEHPARLKKMWTLGSQPQPPAVALRNGWPPVVRDMRAARRVLGSYAWEETSFPAKYAEDFNRTLDLITVVSTQTEKLLRDAGVCTPIAVVGNGVDHLLEVSPSRLPIALPPGFRFLHVSSCFPRKGVDLMLEAFGRVFRIWDDVCLIIKTFPNPHNDVTTQLAARRAADPYYPRVELIEIDWTPSQIVGLYQACNALVSPSRGEGFGLPIAEAMIQRLPVIVTAWGGHMDYCTDENVWLVNYIPSPAQTHINLPDSLWAEPNADSLDARLREVFSLSPEQRQRKTTLARQQVLARYTWRQVAERTLVALAAVERMPAPLPAPCVGWISTWGSRCGIAAYSEHLCAAFAADRLHIFAPCNETPERPDPANLVRNWALGADRMDEVAAKAIELKLDALIIHFNWAFFSLDALTRLNRAMKAAGIKVFLDIHNTKSAPAGRALNDALAALAGCTRILAHTLDDIRRLKNLGLSDNVTLFPLAVYHMPLPDAATLAAQREALGLGGKTVLASYGFLMPHKGLLQLLEAMPPLLAARPQLHLLMLNAYYSDAASGAELARIKERIVALGLQNSVTLKTDFLPEAESIALLALADLVVFPYQNTEESSSAAVRMGLTAGRAVAVTPLPIFDDVADAVDILPGTSPHALATGLANLLEQQAQAAVRAAREGKARAHAERRDSRRLSLRLLRMVQGCCL